MAAESSGDVKTIDAWYRADDGMVVGRHLVEAVPRRADLEIGEERMPPRRARLHPWLERRRHDEGGEITGDECRRRRTRSFFDAAVGREVRHREAHRSTLGPEMKAGLTLDHHRRAHELWDRLRLH